MQGGLLLAEETGKVHIQHGSVYNACNQLPHTHYVHYVTRIVQHIYLLHSVQAFLSLSVPTICAAPMDPDSPTFLLLGPLTALTLHALVLRKFEVDHLTISIVATSCITYGLLAFLIQLGPATKLLASFWVTLWLWIGAYRAFFHPLRDYPGPFAAKLSKWWTIKQNWSSDMHFHRIQQQLQRDYGDYVRTGMFRTPYCMTKCTRLTLKALESSPYLTSLLFSQSMVANQE
jgi:hypothetical protein